MPRFAFAPVVGAAIVLIGLSATLPAAAQSQRACGERDRIVERLASKYGETRQSIGLNHNNGVLEVFASDETGTWTILITMPTGMACLLAAGESWDPAPVAVTKSGKAL